jgi:hypothetical protein
VPVEVDQSDAGVDATGTGKRARDERATTAHHERDPSIAPKPLDGVADLARHRHDVIDRDHARRRVPDIASDADVEIARVGGRPRIGLVRAPTEGGRRVLGPTRPADGIDRNAEERERSHRRGAYRR